MIGSLEGLIVHKSPPHLLLDVGGVGYEIEAPMSSFYGLPSTGERVRLLTHLVVREDAHILYGFATADERVVFRALLKVSGVGPKIALALLSGMSAADFARCVRESNHAALTRIPGVGRKIAERVVIEMRDRIDALGAGMIMGVSREGAGVIAAQDLAADPASEAWNALVALGYKPAEATKMLKGVDTGSTEERIRRALQSAAL
jgi:Holliday junction DNA helicase RuvA